MRVTQPLFYIFAIFVLVFSVNQCGTQKKQLQHPDPGDTLATAGSQTVTVRDFMVAFQESESFETMLLNPDVTIPKTINAIIKKNLFEEHLAQKARKDGLDTVPAFKEYHANVIRDELYQKVILHDVLQNIRVSEKDMKRYYDENRGSLYLEKGTNQIVVRGIYIEFGEKRAKEEAQKIATQAFDEITRGADFETVAKKVSDASIQLRGKENTFPLGRFDPEIAKRLEILNDGEITPVFEFRNRFWIFKRVRFIDTDYIPFDSVRFQILHTLTAEQTQNGVFLLTQGLIDKHNLLSNPSWLDDPGQYGEDAVVLSVPEIYQLTLGEFLKLAQQQQKLSAKEQKEYLDTLGNKAVCLAEAKSRGWNESDIGPALKYWDNRKLAQNYILAEMDKQVDLTEEKMREFFEKERENFQTPPRYDIGRLFFSVQLSQSTNATETRLLLARAKAMATSAWDVLNEGHSFDDTAAQFAQTGEVTVTASEMKNITLSDLNNTERGFIAPNDSVVLKPGEYTEPEEILNISKQRFGYEIFFMRHITPSRPMTYGEARVLIGQRVAQKASKALRELMEKDYFKENQIQLNQDVFQAVDEYMKTLVKRPDLQSGIAQYEIPKP